MSDSKIKKRIKSFSLKDENAKKIEKIAYEEKKAQSSVVDEMVEDFDGDR